MEDLYVGNITASSFSGIEQLTGSSPMSFTQQAEKYAMECVCMNGGIQALAYVLVGAGILAVCLSAAFWILEDIIKKRPAKAAVKKEEVVK